MVHAVEGKRGARRVVCVEPHPAFFEIMVVNIIRNDMWGQVLPLPCAVSSRREKGKQYHIDRKQIVLADNPTRDSIAMTYAYPFLNLLRDYGPFDVLKMDIEGMEYEIFAEMNGDYRDLEGVRYVEIECHWPYKSAMDMVRDKLRVMGFDLDLTGDVNHDNPLRGVNRRFQNSGF